VVRTLLAAAISLLLAVLGSGALAAPVRIFAVGHKQRLADAVTYADYRAKMAAMMDASDPERATRVQAGVDDVASHLADRDPGAPANALVVFPESAGLIAAFIGTRGAPARQQTSSTVAIATLLATYATPLDHYAAEFPNEPVVRTLVLALTDTLYRAFYETFRDLAVEHGVYLAASADLAPARRIDAADDPDLVALLRDPDEPMRSYAYVATTPRPVNTTFVFAPDGSVLVPDGRGGLLRSPFETGGVIRGSTDKAYLTPIEQPPPGQAAGLALAFGSVRDMEVLPTPVGRLAIVISKDAWMVDVNDRFRAKGARVFVQPEAFDSWAFTTDEWSPDVFKEGGFANLQHDPAAVVNVNASMTGNLLDITFDGQTAILGRRQKSSPGPLSASNAWIGQNPDGGFLALAPWIMPDPGILDATLSLAERRTILADAGQLLEPGSGVPCADTLAVGACENGYREAVVWADVDPDAPRAVDPTRVAPPTFGPSVRVNPPEASPTAQAAPAIAARGNRVFVAWHEAAGPLPSVRLAISSDGGETFGPPIVVSGRPPGTVAELNPALAVRGREVAVVWQELVDGLDDDLGRIMLARFDVRGRPLGQPVRVDDAASGKWLPAVTFAGHRPMVTWIDERDQGPEGEALEHVYLARGAADGSGFEPAVRLGLGDPIPLAAHLDNEWSPAIAAHGRWVHVAWVGFQHYNWDVFSATSADGGRSFAPAVRVDDFPAVERLNGHPALAVGRHAVHVAWTDLRARQPDTNVYYARSDDHGATFGANRRLDDADAGIDPDQGTPSNQWDPDLVADRDRLFAAWQDDRGGNDDVYFTTGDATLGTFAPSERVDDTGDGPSAQTRPRLATARHGRRRVCHVVWEDDRDGDPDVYAAHRPCGDP
jgi:hypothetical protein